MIFSKLYVIFIFIIIFGSLVIVHELGHFLMAKLFKIKVKEFSVGFGSVIAKRIDKSGVQWSIRSTPFGGYVAFDDEKVDSEHESSIEKVGKTLNEASFKEKLLIFLAGPIANLLTAFAVMWSCLVFTGYTPPPSNIIGQSFIQSIKPQDRITSVNGAPVHSWKDIEMALSNLEHAKVRINHQAEEITLSADVPVQMGFFQKIFSYLSFFKAKKPETKPVKWGIMPLIPKTEKVGVFKAILMSVHIVFTYIQEFFITLGLIAQKGLGILSGPLGIAKGLSNAPNLSALLSLMCRLSVSLGMFNLLPIPGLDGGQVLLEGIRRATNLSERFLKIWHYGAFGLLIGLMFYITLLDLIKMS